MGIAVKINIERKSDNYMFKNINYNEIVEIYLLFFMSLMLQYSELSFNKTQQLSGCRKTIVLMKVFF